ncbi:MAG: hypothetical protein IH614_19850, partial [Desulfuromonadales bacterium]|nr:hypothetical protein [Desulfuromonadales bacterium]
VLELILRPARMLLAAGVGPLPAVAPVIGPIGRLAAVLLLLLVLSLLLVGRWGRKWRPAATVATWGCGYPAASSRMQYTAGGYAELAQKQLFPVPLRPHPAGGPPAGLFPPPASWSQEAPDPVLSSIFLPAFRSVAERCQRLRFIQQGKVHLYLFYIFVTCAVLLTWSVLAHRGWSW